MADMLSIPFVRKIFKRISGKTSFRDINNYLKTVEYNNELDPKRIEEFPLIRSHFCYYPCSGMILPIGEDEGLFLGLEKRGEGPIYGDFFYRLKNGTHHKHIAPIFLEKNYEVSGYFGQRLRGIFGPFDELAKPFEFICMNEGEYLQEEVRLAENYIEKLQKTGRKFEERTPLFKLCKQAFIDIFIFNTTIGPPIDVDHEYKVFQQEVNEDVERETLIQKLHML